MLVVVGVACALAMGFGVACIAADDGVAPAATLPGMPPRSLAAEPTTPVDRADLLLVDPANGEVIQVAAIEGRQRGGERSPDGSSIAFQGRLTDPGRPQIFVLDASGDERQLTDLSLGASQPTWSPDGRRIAFVAPSRRGSDTDIFVMRADGSGVRRLTGTDRDDLAPDWSPDGTRIAFQSGEWTNEPASAIWVAELEDRDLTRMPSTADGDGFPRWAPDGRRLTFLRYDDAPTGNLEWDDSDLWVMRSDGARQRRVVAAEGPLPDLPVPEWFDSFDAWGVASADDHFQGPPTWSPDGRTIAYTGSHCDCITLVDVASGELVDHLIGDFDDATWDPHGILVTGPPLEVGGAR